MLHQNILTIRDEDATGKVFNEIELRFDKLEVTVRDIIVERVFQEVTLYNQKAEQYRYALVQPKSDEIKLNAKTGKKRHIDPEKQVTIALKAFESNGFFILVDDVQSEHLEQVVTITPETSINFVKLTPLVGG